MEDYATILLYAIPLFLIFIVLEQVVAWKKGMVINRWFDVISSLSSGISNIVKEVLGLSIVIISYGYMSEHWSLVTIENKWFIYVLSFIGIDFAGYWSHRFSHEINLLWNRHIIHHSSEEFNLSCAMRQSVSEIFAIFTILYLPLAIIGVPKEVIAIVAPLHLFIQFWYHTRLIHKMGWLENIIVTPSHHRVHHAINPEYMDRNYGQIFIFWDKWFGTFQEEKVDIPPVYGVTRAVKTWNPWLINYKHLWLLILDFIRTSSWKDKAIIWFKPTGWRPADVAEKYPVDYTKEIYQREKYDTYSSKSFQIWSGLQLVMTLLLTLYFFSQIGKLEAMDIILYGLFIFLHIFSYTSLMDGSWLGVVGEMIKVTCVLLILFLKDFDWFGMSGYSEIMNGIILSYFILSATMTTYFYFLDAPKPMEFTISTGEYQYAES